MLAAKTASLETLRYPLLASAKLDGIRATMIDGVLYSRTMKPIPNKAIQKFYGGMAYKLNGLDGELIVGMHDNDVYRRTVSAVMSHEGDPTGDTIWWIFDKIDMDEKLGFKDRYEVIRGCLYTSCPAQVRCLGQNLVYDADQVVAAHTDFISAGHEGLILRDPLGAYKQGRSTTLEQGMIKVKMFNDSEAEVIGVVELMHNDNEATTNEIGLTKRSSHKANKRASGKMGALQVRDVDTNVVFEIGTGFTDADRCEMWRSPPIGRLVKYKYFAYGVKDRPRHPVFLGFRAKIDL